MALYHPEPTFNQFERERFERLKELFPDAFTDGEVNWEAIYKIFQAEDSDDEERYGLNFPGKRAARQLTYEPPTGAIHPETESELEKTTGNVFIEGDNLEVLKHLRKAYAGRVKMIYIDPPYNTGNSFVYDDNRFETIKSYEMNANLRNKSKDGKNGKLTTNARTNGRFHSKWLSMMYPRLRVARDLLSEDGVIFISIDDNEQAVLKLLMDELFGEENFVANVIWEKSYSPRMDVENFSISHDYVIVYSFESIYKVHKEFYVQNEKQFNYYDSDKQKYYRRRSIRKEGMNSLRSDAPKAFFPLISPGNTEVFPIKPNGIEGNWRWSKDKFNLETKLENVEWVFQNNKWEVYAKQYLEESAFRPPQTIWKHTEVGHNHLANDEIRLIFNNRIFDTPKPTKLLKRILQLSTSNNNSDLILDFFAGSGTTGQAVMEMNAEDGGNRQFILVQLDEETNEKSEAKQAGYNFISEITKERLRRAAKKIREEKGEEATKEVDLDFRSFRVEPSHFRAWDEVVYDETMSRRRNLETLDLQLDEYLHTSIDPEFDKLNLTHFWGLVTEMALSEGFPLDSEFKIDNQTYTKNTVLVVHHPKSQSELMVLHICFDDKIHPETVAQLAKEKIATFICKDSAIDDESKVRLTDQCKCLIRTF